MKKTIEKVVVERIIPEGFKINLDEMPKHELNSLCCVILSSVEKAKKDPKFIAEYERRLPELEARSKAWREKKARR